jgi:hypothetical protein
VRCLVDVPGQKVPSIASGEMANYLKTVVAPQVLLFIQKKKIVDDVLVVIFNAYLLQQDFIMDTFILADSSRNLRLICSSH